MFSCYENLIFVWDCNEREFDVVVKYINYFVWNIVLKDSNLFCESIVFLLFLDMFLVFWCYGSVYSKRCCLKWGILCIVMDFVSFLREEENSEMENFYINF